MVTGMKRTSLLLSAALFGTSLAIGSLSAPAAYAQGKQQTVNLARVDVVHLAAGYRASKINGSAVYNNTNEKIGTVDDLIVNPNDRVLYAVLSVGGFLGVGDHLIAVPYDMLKMTGNDREQKIVLNNAATKEDLKALPQFHYKN
jgi:sporulation protein YlmC with PRC-barrel domain